MELTYSSSFESDEDEKAGQNAEENCYHISKSYLSHCNKVGKNVELDLLCKGVSDLPLATDTDQKVTKTSWVFDTCVKSVEKNNFLGDVEKNMLKDQYGQARNLLKPVFYLKRSASMFKGSASINRRRKLQQIEHDNLVNILTINVNNIFS